MSSIEPTHITKKGEFILSIPFYTAELEKLNDFISGVITTIENAKERERKKFMMKMNESSTNLSSASSDFGNTSVYPIQEDETEDTNTFIQDYGSNKNIEITPSNLKPVEEVVTPEDDDEHRRVISELPIDDLVFEPLPIKNLTQTLQPLRESDEMNAILDETRSDALQEEISTTSEKRQDLDALVIDTTKNRSIEEAILSLDNGSIEQGKDNDKEIVEAPLDLSDLQNDPLFGFLFDDIINENHSSEDSKVKRRLFESNFNSTSPYQSLVYGGETSSCETKKPKNSDESICDDASSVYVEKKPSDEEQESLVDCQKKPCSRLVASDHNDVSVNDDDDASSVYVEKHRPRLTREFSHKSDNSRQDDPSLYVILDDQTNKSFIADLRRQLRKDPSCRSLFSESSGDLNGTKILVDASILNDQETIGEKSDRSITFDTIKSSLSSASKKTKGTIRTTLSKTSSGVKKSFDLVHGGVKTSATVVHSGAKRSVIIVQNGVKKSIVISTDAVQDTVKKSVAGIKRAGVKSVKLATNLIRGSEDGRVRDGGIVTFTTLSAKACCVQMLHHEKPFTFTVSNVPSPEHIYWQNVGLSHKTQQIGFLVAQLLTAALCLFWTFPVAFVSSLSEIESLKRIIPSLESAIEAYPWIQPLLSQLNPGNFWQIVSEISCAGLFLLTLFLYRSTSCYHSFDCDS